MQINWFLGAMLVLGPPPFMSEGFMGVIMIQYFMNYSIGKECYVFISFNIRPYNGKLQSLVTPLPFGGIEFPLSAAGMNEANEIMRRLDTTSGHF